MSIRSFISALMFAVILGAPFSRIKAQTTENMNLSATVLPRPSDYQISVSATPGDHQLPQGTELIYTITYGASLPADTSPVQIDATFLPGRINGSPVPSLYPAEILTVDATNAYGNIEPVINPITHSITWSLPNLPGNTLDQTVTFKARMNEVYTGIQSVDFDLFVRFSTPYVILNQTITKSYIYREVIVTPTPIPTAVPSPSPIPLNIGNIHIQTISDSQATITTYSSTPSIVVLHYGTDPLNTFNTLTSTRTSAGQHTFLLTSLTPSTTYYYYTTATDASHQTYRTTRMMFKTAVPSIPAMIDRSSLFITSDDTIFNPKQYSEKSGTASAYITLPTDTTYGIQIYIPGAITVKTVEAHMRNMNVLGSSINTLFAQTKMTAPDPSTDSIELTETSPGIFIGNLKTKPTGGNFDMVIRVSDVYGNISESSISRVHVVHPFTVRHRDTNAPAEYARIFLSRYNSKSGSYIPLSPAFLKVTNPMYTNYKGEASFVLPEGTYKALVTLYGSESTVVFSISGDAHSGFPIVQIPSGPTSLRALLKYYLNTFLDVVLVQSLSFLRSLSKSIALYDLSEALSLVALVFVTFMAFASRTLYDFGTIWKFILRSIHTRRLGHGEHAYITGTVLNGDTGKPLALAGVNIIDSTSNTVALCMRTDRYGHYFAHVVPDKHYSLLISAQGYEQTEPIAYDRMYSPEHLIHKLYRTHPKPQYALSTTFWFINTIFGWLFEVLLLASILFEFLFLEYFGLMKTLPFLLISTANLTLWILYLRHKSTLTSFL